MKKRTEKQKLKDRADQIFSEYIRLKYADWKEFVACYTCGKESHYKDGMQNGHFISRGSNVLRFSEDNCRPQCVGCNVFKNGNYIEFTRRMIDEVGIEKVDELRRLGKTTRQLTEKDLQKIIDEYSEKLKMIKVCYSD